MSKCDLENKVVTFEDILWKEKSRAAEQELADDVAGNKPKPVTKPAEDFDGMDTVPTNTSRTRDVKFDFLIGADGTYSSVRQSIMRSVEVDYSQEYVGAVWCDFIIPSNQDGDYPMDSKCLHVWPADEGIVMAQPDFVSAHSFKHQCKQSLIAHRTALSVLAWSTKRRKSGT